MGIHGLPALTICLHSRSACTHSLPAHMVCLHAQPACTVCLHTWVCLHGLPAHSLPAHCTPPPSERGWLNRGAPHHPQPCPHRPPTSPTR